MARRGRQREFDEDAAVAAITRVFWSQGYATTSIQDLVDASGVQRASLYGAFGNKKALLLLALARYRADVTATLKILQDDTPVVLPALREFLMIPLAPSRPRMGCLLGNTAVEVSTHDDDIGGVVREGFAALEKALRLALERAYRSGELPERNSAAQARMLMAVQQGLQVIARTAPDPVRFVDSVDAVLCSLR